MDGTFGLIVSTRGFFPDRLAVSGREEIIRLLRAEGLSVVCPSLDHTRLGLVETWEDAKKCAVLFKEKQDGIDGIIVSLPNFGNEKGVAHTLRLSGLKVPVLVHAFADELDALDLAHRRDSFCGKISVCNNLSQFGIPFSLTRVHAVSPQSASFKEDLYWFAGVCRVVNGLKNARLGAIGTRPGTFNTVRYSEKILESLNISMETIDLSDIFAQMSKVSDADSTLKAKIEEIQAYCDTTEIPPEKIRIMARFGITVERWMKENNLVSSAIQCWTSIENTLGIMPCTVMSMMSEKLLPSACDVDVMGALAMYTLQLASGAPSAFVDWNNNYGDDPNRGVVFHCGSFASSFFEKVKMGCGDVIGTSVGKENAYGSLAGKIKAGPLTYARFSTDDVHGCLRAYVGEGEITEDDLDTYGARGVVRIPRMQELLKFICKNGFEHHAAINRSHVASMCYEALSNYLGIDTYWHREEDSSR